MPITEKIHRHYWEEKKWWQMEDYVEYPVLTYKKHYARTKTVERKIRSLLRRGKPFILNTNILTGDDIWFVDSWGWVAIHPEACEESKEIWEEKMDLRYSNHIKNCLPFLRGSQPIWGNPPIQRKRKVSMKRGISTRRN